MMSRIFQSSLLISAIAVTTGFCQTQPQQLVPVKEPVRLSVAPQNEIKFRIIDPIKKHVQQTEKTVAAQGERQLAVPRAQEWNTPVSPATMPRPELPPAIAAPRPMRRPVFQADTRLQNQRKLVPQIRLVQAEDVDDSFLDDLRTTPGDAGSPPVGGDDIDELLKQAQDLIKEEREKATDERLSPDEIRTRMQDELDRLLPDEESDGDDDDLLSDSGDDAEEDLTDLVDPEPKPMRRQQRQLPYTMGDIFDDEDEVDPVCEQMFCERMWACAGGRCMTPMDRMKRNFRRNYALFWSPCGTPVCRPMEDFQCPPRNRQPQTQMASQAPVQQLPMTEQPPMMESFPTGEYPVETLPIESPVEFSTTDIPTEAVPSVLGDSAVGVGEGVVAPTVDANPGTIFGPAGSGSRN